MSACLLRVRCRRTNLPALGKGRKKGKDDACSMCPLSYIAEKKNHFSIGLIGQRSGAMSARQL